MGQSLLSLLFVEIVYCSIFLFIVAPMLITRLVFADRFKDDAGDKHSQRR